MPDCRRRLGFRRDGCGHDSDTAPLEPPCIIKSVWEHGSRGLDDENVVLEGEPRWSAGAAGIHRPNGPAAFCRDSSLMAANSTCRCWTALKARRSCRWARWTSPPSRTASRGSSAIGPSGTRLRSNTTTRRAVSTFHEHDRHLVEQLKRLALECWRIFGLRGYVRIDFRVDRAGQPWILEINTNPCLSPEAGYVAAMDEAGVAYDEADPPDRRRAVAAGIAAGSHAEANDLGIQASPEVPHKPQRRDSNGSFLSRQT